MAEVERRLKSCPFCSGTAEFVRVCGEYPPKYTVVCTDGNCGATIGAPSATKAEAAARWNRRAYSINQTHDGCSFCPVVCSEYERMSGYRGSACAALRAAAGDDYDPELIFRWDDDFAREDEARAQGSY